MTHSATILVSQSIVLTFGAEDVLGLMNPDSKDLAVSLTSYPVKIYSLKNLPEERLQTSLREIVAVFKRSSDREAVLEYYKSEVYCRAGNGRT